MNQRWRSSVLGSGSREEVPFKPRKGSQLKIYSWIFQKTVCLDANLLTYIVWKQKNRPPDHSSGGDRVHGTGQHLCNLRLVRTVAMATIHQYGDALMRELEATVSLAARFKPSFGIVETTWLFNYTSPTFSCSIDVAHLLCKMLWKMASKFKSWQSPASRYSFHPVKQTRSQWNFKTPTQHFLKLLFEINREGCNQINYYCLDIQRFFF